MSSELAKKLCCCGDFGCPHEYVVTIDGYTCSDAISNACSPVCSVINGEHVLTGEDCDPPMMRCYSRTISFESGNWFYVIKIDLTCVNMNQFPTLNYKSIIRITVEYRANSNSQDLVAFVIDQFLEDPLTPEITPLCGCTHPNGYHVGNYQFASRLADVAFVGGNCLSHPFLNPNVSVVLSRQ